MGPPRLVFVLLGVLAFAVSGCGGGRALDGGAAKPRAAAASRGAGQQAPGSPANVVRGWAEALRAGDVGRAAGFFAVPSTVQNGTPLVTLRSRAAVRGFNLSLPCGAKVLRTAALRGYTLAEFTLVERRGPGGGQCGAGVGGRAATAFLIRGGKIVQWRRIARLPGRRGEPAPPAPAAPPANAPEV